MRCAGIAVLAGCGNDRVVRQELPPETVASAVSAGGQTEGTAWGIATASAVLRGGVAQAGETAVVRAETGSQPLQIRASHSTWDLAKHTAHFEGNVTVVRGVVTMTCTALDVNYDGARVDRIVATDHVRVTREGRLATAETAELEGATGKITLTGAPTLAEGPNHLAGTTITLFLDDEKAECVGAGDAPCTLTVDGSALGAGE